ncbi:glycoside hydrolase family 3 C-terminal domain-containing protein [Streptomyces sp. NPDC005774]|uniref:glycoside hydrolase family 3 C-terminal domain-containing protein n=1 Tax=Streptomyces sp. NPDC005774 TaxID=3364728 RepID=UPI003679DEC9
MFANGLFDTPVPAPSDNVSTQEHRDLAHEAAIASTVLLSNHSSALPLPASVKSLAVIGPADTDVFTGVAGSTYVDPGTWTTPLQSVRTRAGSSVKITHSQGTKGDLPLAVVPSTVLRDGTGKAGLTVKYFAGADATGTPIVTMTDASRLHHRTRGGSARRLVGEVDRHPRTGHHRPAPLLPAARRYDHTEDQRRHGRLRHPADAQVLPRTVRLPAPGTAQLTAGRAVSVELTYTNATAETGTCGLTLGWQPDSFIPAAVKAAGAADAAVIFVNRVAGEAMDHEGLGLPGDQNQLITAVAAVNPRTIVVLNTDGPVAAPG